MVIVCNCCGKAYTAKHRPKFCSNECREYFQDLSEAEQRRRMKNAKKQYPIKEDCVSYCAEQNMCIALVGMFCEKEQCKFYKAKE